MGTIATKEASVRTPGDQRFFDGAVPMPPRARPRPAAPATVGGVPAGWEPPPFVPAGDAWMYPSDERED